MNKTTLGMAVVALIMAFFAYLQGGFSLVGRALYAGGTTLVSITHILVAAFLVAGFVSMLIPKDKVTKWLSTEAGWKGPFWGSMMGAMVPGGPFFFYPLMATLIGSGASVGTMLSFVAAKTLWFVGRLPMEIAFVGIRLTLIRIAVTFAVPILVGSFVNYFLPGLSEKIRFDVEQLHLKRATAVGNHSSDSKVGGRS